MSWGFTKQLLMDFFNTSGSLAVNKGSTINHLGACCKTKKQNSFGGSPKKKNLSKGPPKKKKNYVRSI